MFFLLFVFVRTDGHADDDAGWLTMEVASSLIS
jgi:hypothetical protein